MKMIEKKIISILICASVVLITNSCKDNVSIPEELSEKDVQILSMNKGYLNYLFQENQIWIKRCFINKDSSLIDSISIIHAETVSLLNIINKIESELVTEFGGVNEEGKLKKHYCDTIVERFFLKENNAILLKEKINEYVKSLIKYGFNPGIIAFDGTNHPLFTKDTNFKGKDFYEFNFEDANFFQSIMILNYYRYNVILAERTFLFSKLTNQQL